MQRGLRRMTWTEFAIGGTIGALLAMIVILIGRLKGNRHDE
jgi:fumarate reductase subunit D